MKLAGTTPPLDDVCDEAEIALDLFEQRIRDERRAVRSERGAFTNGLKEGLVLGGKLQARAHDLPQLLGRAAHALCGRAGAVHELRETVLEGPCQQRLLVLEVEVEGALGHAGPLGNALHRGVGVADLGDHAPGGVEDLTGAKVLDDLFLGARASRDGHEAPLCW